MDVLVTAMTMETVHAECVRRSGPLQIIIFEFYGLAFAEETCLRFQGCSMFPNEANH